jgi:hypothetical protein
LFSLLLNGRFLIGSSILQLLEDAIPDELALQRFDRILDLVVLNFNFQDFLLYLLVARLF